MSGRAPRRTRQLNRKLHSLYIDPPLELSSDISVVQHLENPNSYADRHRLPYRGGDRNVLLRPLTLLSPDEILECIWFLMDRGRNSLAMFGHREWHDRICTC